MNRLRQGWNHHALGWITFAIMLGLYLTYFPSQYVEWAGEQQQHGQPVPSAFSWDYLNAFMNRVLEAISGESYQVWATIMLTKWWIERNSAESRDGEDEINHRLRRMEKHMGIHADADVEVEEAARAARYNKPWRWLLPFGIVALISVALVAANAVAGAL